MQSELHAQARRFADAGIKVFPCLANAKQPATPNGFHDASDDAAQIDTWWGENPNYNIGLVPEDAGWAVIDIDPGGEASWIEALADGGHEPTYEVSTPRGGKHLYFEGSLPSTASRLAEHVDTRGVGGYVLVPPSIVAGKPYTVLHDRAIAPVPEWIAKRIAKAKHTAVDAGDKPLDTDIAIARTTGYLRGLAERGDVAISGRGGNSRTLKLFAQLKDLGVSGDTALRLVLEEWNPACEPPWELPDLTTLRDNGYRYAQNSAGAATDTRPAEEAFEKSDAFQEALRKGREKAAKAANDDIPIEDEKPDTRPFPTPKAGSAVLAREVAPVQELIKNYIQKDIANFLVGPGGTHKSRLLLQFGLTIAAGAINWGDPTERAEFHVLSYEDDYDEVTRRTQKIAARLKLPEDSAGNWHVWDLLDDGRPLIVVKDSGAMEVTPLGEHVFAYLRDRPGHKFVGIDSCYNAIAFEGHAKINETAVMRAVRTLDQKCRECDCTMLVLWHPSQAGIERGDGSGWSVAWHNAPRRKISIKRLENDGQYELSVAKINHDAAPPTLTLYFAAGVMLPLTALDEKEIAGKRYEACVKAATDAANGGTPIKRQPNVAAAWIEQIASAINRTLSSKEIKAELDKACRAGRLEYRRNTPRGPEAGWYPVTPKPTFDNPVFVARVRALARMFDRWGEPKVTVSRLYKAHVQVSDPTAATFKEFNDTAVLTDDQLGARFETFRANFVAACGAGVLGAAYVMPTNEGEPQWCLLASVLAASLAPKEANHADH